MNTFEMEYNFDDIPTTFEYRYCQLCANFRIYRDEYGNNRFHCTKCNGRPYTPKNCIIEDREGNLTCRFFREI